MTFAFGHLIGVWLAGKGYEKFGSKKLSHYAWFFLLLGGILPDSDLLLEWTIGIESHRTITHSLLFAVIALVVVYVGVTLLWKKELPRRKEYALAVGSGIITHLLLDMLSSGVPLLWPLPYYFSYFNIEFGVREKITIVHQLLPFLEDKMRRTIIDMALGTAWIFYFWYKKRIQF